MSHSITPAYTLAFETLEEKLSELVELHTRADNLNKRLSDEIAKLTAQRYNNIIEIQVLTDGMRGLQQAIGKLDPDYAAAHET